MIILLLFFGGSVVWNDEFIIECAFKKNVIASRNYFEIFLNRFLSILNFSVHAAVKSHIFSIEGIIIL